MSIRKSKARKLAEFLRNITAEAKLTTEAVQDDKVVTTGADLDSKSTDTTALVSAASVTSYVGDKLDDYVHGTHDINLTFTGDVTGHGTITDMSHTSFNLTLDAETLPNQSGYAGKFLTTDGTTASWATVDTSNGDTAYSWGDHAQAGYLTSETNDYVDSVSFSTSSGILSLGRTGSLSDLTVDLDGRYLQSFTETDTLQSVTARGASTNQNILIEKNNPVLTLSDTNANPSTYPTINFTTTNNQGVNLYYTEFDSELPLNGYGLVLDADSANAQFPDNVGAISLNVLGEVYAGSRELGTLNKVWHAGNLDPDNYLLTSNYVDTTYNVSAVDVSGGKAVRLTGSDGTTDDVKFAAGSNVSLARSGDTITISSTDTNTDTNTTDWYVANSSGGNQFKVDKNENVRFEGTGATSVSFNASNNKITISSTDTNTETTTNLVDNGDNTITYTNEEGTAQTIDLSLYLDDTNLARILSGTMNSSGVATFTRDDDTTFTVDMSVLLDDTNLSRITSASWNTSNGVLTLTRNDNTTVAVDLDGRYVQKNADIVVANAGPSLTLTDTTDSDDHRIAFSNSSTELHSINTIGSRLNIDSVQDIKVNRNGTKILDIVSSGLNVTGAVNATSFSGSLDYNDITNPPVIDNSVDYINGASFNTSNGILTLSGVGRAGATVDLDNRYLTGYTETDTLQSVTTRGNTTTNNIRFTQDEGGIEWERNTDRASIKFYNDSDSDTNSRLEFNIADNTNEDFRFTYTTGTTTTELLRMRPDGGVSGLTFRGNTVFHDGYHPNADKWTTARSHTVTLTGDVTGSATQSVDGTGNKTWTIGTVIADDSHNHNNYLRSDTSDVHQFNTSTGEALTFRNNTSGGQIQLGFQQTGPEGLHHRAYIRARKSNVGSYAGIFEIALRGTNASDNENVFKLETNSNPTWKGQQMWHDGYHPVDWTDISGKPPIDNSVDYINSASFNTATGVLTLSGVGRAGATIDLDGRYLRSETDSQTLSWNGSNGQLSISNGNTVDLDNRYLTSYSETDTLQSVTNRGNTTTQVITANDYRFGNGDYVKRSVNKWVAGYADNFSNGSTGWKTIAKIRLTSGCSGDTLYGTLYENAYHDARVYQIAVVARAECDFTTNNESHVVEVGCTTIAAAGDSDYRNKIRVSLVESSTNSRTYELQVYETPWNSDKWELCSRENSTGNNIWTKYTSGQTIGTATGTPRVTYHSKVQADYVRARTEMRAPVFYDSDSPSHYADFANSDKSVVIAGKYHTNKSSGTIASIGTISDAVGHNPSYGTYIGGTSGSYLYHGTGDYPIYRTGSTNYQVWTSKNFNPSNYSTTSVADGRYVRKTGDTMTGPLTVPGVLKVTETGTAQHFLIGNQDSGGVNKPAMIRGVNGQLQLGHGSSWSGEGGTMTVGLTVAGPKVGIGTTSPASTLHLQNVNGGAWNDGLIIDDPTGWAATIYRRSDDPKMFQGLYANSDNFIWMSPEYSNSGTTVSAPRNDAILQALPGTNTLEFYLPSYFGQNVGIGTTNPGAQLHVYKGGVGANTGVTDMLRLELNRSDHSTTPSGPAILFKDQDTNNTTNEARIKMMTVNSTLYGDNDEAASNLVFETTNGGTAADKMIVTGRGYIGMGTNNPKAPLHVTGNVKVGNTNSAASTTVTSTLDRFLEIAVQDGSGSGQAANYTSGSGIVFHHGGTCTSAIKHLQPDINTAIFRFDSDRANTRLEIEDGNTRLLKGSTHSLRVQTNSGYLDLGPQNTTHCHINTDRGSFYLNKEITVDSGIIGSYNEDLHLRRSRNSAHQIRIAAGTTTISQNTVIQGNLTVNGSISQSDGFGTLYTFNTTQALSTSWANVSAIAGGTLPTGTYAIQIKVDNHDAGGGNYSEHYSGTMAWYGSNTNDGDSNEIPLHNAGHAYNGAAIYARTLRRLSGQGGMILQLAASGSISSDAIEIKIRRLI